jgi:hypothetical protein
VFRLLFRYRHQNLSLPNLLFSLFFRFSSSQFSSTLIFKKPKWATIKTYLGDSVRSMICPARRVFFAFLFCSSDILKIAVHIRNARRHNQTTARTMPRPTASPSTKPPILCGNKASGDFCRNTNNTAATTAIRRILVLLLLVISLLASPRVFSRALLFSLPSFPFTGADAHQSLAF